MPSITTSEPLLVSVGVLLIGFTCWNCVILTMNKTSFPKFLDSQMLYLLVQTGLRVGTGMKERNE